MSARRRRPHRPWYHRIHATTWILLWLLLAASASVALGPWFAETPRQRRLQVQVLNGSGARGLAGQVAELLRDRGMDVVSVGNADSDTYLETVILVRRGDVSVARRVAAALGRGTPLEQRDPTLLVDVTVILGRDVAADRTAGGP